MTAETFKNDPLAEQKTLEPRMISSAELLRQHKEIIIRHGAERYRLRMTSNNKLILTK
jgi:hemin uptake protein HemP